MMLTSCNHKSEIKLQNEIISAVIKHAIVQLPNDTVFNDEGRMLEININNKPDIILINETETDLGNFYFRILDSYENLKTEAGSFSSEAFEDLKNKIRYSIKIDTIKKFEGNIKYMPKYEINKLFVKKGGWQIYHDKYGRKPYVYVSRAGINKNNDKAIVLLNYLNGRLNAAGYIIFINKIHGTWIVKEQIQLWLS